ncbi:CHAT domain-containing protein [Roseobacter litoralis]|uniref:CHAT domain-containing protein n=1 Tax=Roseobacter litoralis TaxID=42443 RepID=UPI002494DB1F|nr:CHAT domain-containing protein [Roseobacter litoralis]
MTFSKNGTGPRDCAPAVMLPRGLRAAISVLETVQSAFIIFVVILLAGTGPTRAQYAYCDSSNLEEIIAMHTLEILKLDEKFENYWYPPELPPDTIIPDIREVGIQDYLRQLRPRNAAVIFFGQDRDTFCSWLVRPDQETLYHAARPELEHGFGRLTRAFQASLESEVRAFRTAEISIPRMGLVLDDDVPKEMDLETATRAMSALLFPDEFAEAISGSPFADEESRKRIDTLILVPIGLWERSGDGNQNRQRAEQLVTGIGTLPLSMLRVGGRELVDVASVVVSPGFQIFASPPHNRSLQPVDAVIVGNPFITNQRFGTLPMLDGAEEEAKEIAELLNTEPLIRHDATEAGVLQELRRVSETTEYIHLATHGISSGPNPLDGSFLVMASDNPNLLVYDPEDQTARMDDRLTAREISTIKFRANPLVVLSACETGLGKDFPVGTTGLARAWHWAGASSVVVSLWNIDDAVTKGLMMKFVAHALEMPPDQALQKAMKEVRIDHEEPALWAGFTIFGGL